MYFQVDPYSKDNIRSVVDKFPRFYILNFNAFSGESVHPQDMDPLVKM